MLLMPVTVCCHTKLCFLIIPKTQNVPGVFHQIYFCQQKKCIRRSSYYGQNEKGLLPHMLSPMKTLAACLGFQNFVFFPLLNKKTHIWKPYNWSGMRMKLLAPIKITDLWLIVKKIRELTQSHAWQNVKGKSNTAL